MQAELESAARTARGRVGVGAFLTGGPQKTGLPHVGFQHPAAWKAGFAKNMCCLQHFAKGAKTLAWEHILPLPSLPQSTPTPRPSGRNRLRKSDDSTQLN